MTMPLTLEQIGQLGLSESLEKSHGLDALNLLDHGQFNKFGQSQLSNILSSISAYADMSPDLTIRKEVNSWMLRRDRQALTFPDWCQLFRGNQCERHHDHIDRVLHFIYNSFGDYSGLNFSRVRPNDSLNSHLHFPLVCWFDWSITFCEDFLRSFGLDLSDRFDEADFSTIGEMVDFLIEQVAGLETATETAVA